MEEDGKDLSFLTESQTTSLYKKDAWSVVVEETLEVHKDSQTLDKESVQQFRPPSTESWNYINTFDPLTEPDWKGIEGYLTERLPPLRYTWVPLLYQRVSQKPDHWNYLDSHTFEVCTHSGVDLPAYFLPKDPPNGHPLWCDKFDHVKHSHSVFDFDENSGIDLHPLPLNTTHPTFYVTDSTEGHFTFGPLEEPFIVMCMLFDRNIVTSEDWQKYPTNTFTLAIRKQLDEEYMRWR